MTVRYAVAAAALLLLTVPTACDDDESPDEEPAAATTGPSYAIGRTIYREGDPKIVSPGQVQAFVETRHGAVWGTRDGRVFFGDGDQVEHIGRTAEHYLKADHEGSLTAWVEFPDGEPAELVVWDTAEREEVLRTDESTTADMRQRINTYSELTPWGSRDKRPIAYVYAVEGRSVYWLNNEGAVRTDVDDGRTEVLEPDADELTIHSVENGVIASEYYDETQPDSLYPVTIGTELFEGTEIDVGLHTSDLSPEGTYVYVDGDRRTTVVAVSGGSVVADRFTARKHARIRNLVVFGWTADDTLQATGQLRWSTRQVLECEVATSVCRVTAQVPPPSGPTLPKVVLPG